MALNFEIIKEIGQGSYPDVIHFASTQAQVFYINDGNLMGLPTDKINNGEWENATFQDEVNASPDSHMSHFQVDVLPGFGIIGGYKQNNENKHKLIIYEFAHELDRFLNSGTIKHSDNPISSFTLTLENPDLKDPEHPGNIAINEQNSLLSPGAKVKFAFGAGDDLEEFEMGTFYVDRSNFTVASETGNVEGRNVIGKALKDQTLDEKNEYWLKYLHEILFDILTNAQISKDDIVIENTDKEYWFSFSPDTTYMNAIERILEILPTWKMKELDDGRIAIGSDTFSGFPQAGNYVFYRNKDIFSRQITRDDAEVYRRVCVYTKNFAIAEYRDIETYSGWNLQNTKTLYIQVADNSSPETVSNYADEMQERMANVGKIESFTGHFRPYLTVGDEATIVDANGSNVLGLITEVTHNFGKQGFYTNFTVDSGGKLGKGRLTDFIKKIAESVGAGDSKKGIDDVDMDNYINLASISLVTVTSTDNSFYDAKRMIDGKMYRVPNSPNDYSHIGWRPSRSDALPAAKFDFKQRCIIDKINLWLGMDYIDKEDLPNSYTIQYWNSRIWIDLMTVDENIDSEMTHIFEPVEASAIRIILLNEEQNINSTMIREVEIWGNM